MFHKNNYPSSQVVHALPNGRYHWRANNNHRRIPGWKGASYITVRNIDWRQGEHLGNTQYHKAPKWKKDLVRRFYFYGHGRKKSCTERHYRNLKGVGVVGTVCAVGCIALNAADGEALLAPCLYACGKVAGGAAVVNAYSKIINCR